MVHKVDFEKLILNSRWFKTDNNDIKIEESNEKALVTWNFSQKMRIGNQQSNEVRITNKILNLRF